MSRFTCLLATIFVMTVTLTGFAGSDIPDVKGTWLLKAQGVRHHKGQGAIRKTHAGEKTGPVPVEIKMTIDKQDGFRFSGTKESAKLKETVSRVIGFDNKTLYMVDDDGMAFCRLVAPDKMEQVYLHVTKHDSVAGRGIFVRKR